MKIDKAVKLMKKGKRIKYKKKVYFYENNQYYMGEKVPIWWIMVDLEDLDGFKNG